MIMKRRAYANFVLVMGYEMILALEST